MTTSAWSKTPYQRILSNSTSKPTRDFTSGSSGVRNRQMFLDGMTIFVAAILAFHLILGDHPPHVELLIQASSAGRVVGTLCGFFCSLLALRNEPVQIGSNGSSNARDELKHILRLCAVSGTLLICWIYVADLEQMNSPRFALSFLGFVAAGSYLRWMIGRFIASKSFTDKRNILIVGRGSSAHTIREHIQSALISDCAFKGFIGLPESDLGYAAASNPVGTFNELAEQVRRLFVDEIFVTQSCGEEILSNLIHDACSLGVGLRMIPDGLALENPLQYSNPIQFIGGLPTIQLLPIHDKERVFVLKYFIGSVFSALVLFASFPLLCVIAIAIKLDSPGPVLYFSDRVGKRGRVFRCIKFRTMIQNAESLRDELVQTNEREGVLFKLKEDPRVTRIGRFLRKYSLDEFPQFINVLRGEMAVVGPRPALVEEVERYETSQLRRLDVLPGITGLWQVYGRQDPSINTYFSLDLDYIENWSFLLDLNIVLRTVGAVLAGTGS